MHTSLTTVKKRLLKKKKEKEIVPGSQVKVTRIGQLGSSKDVYYRKSREVSIPLPLKSPVPLSTQFPKPSRTGW